MIAASNMWIALCRQVSRRLSMSRLQKRTGLGRRLSLPKLPSMLGATQRPESNTVGNRRPTVAIITESYPYLGLEPFLESEMAHWAGLGARGQVLLLPRTVGGTATRHIPDDVTVDLSLVEKGFAHALSPLRCADLYKVTLREISLLLSERRLGAATAFRAALTTYRSVAYSRRLQRRAELYGPIDIAYCYWNDVTSYGAALAKSHGAVLQVVARAHGFDVYEERRSHGYMPLKRQLRDAFDQVFPISTQGRDYLVRQYGFSPNRLSVKHLGVNFPNAVTPPCDSGAISILTISSCTAVKRLDLVIEALCMAAKNNPTLTFMWTHIGGGPLFPSLHQMAAERLTSLPNLSYSLPGQQPNSYVHSYLRTQRVDFILNVSQSEGVPVSVMEAMSYGVPALAADVGALREVVNEPVGRLMPFVNAEIVSHEIVDFAAYAKDASRRERARKFISHSFDATTNYSAFVTDLAASAVGMSR